MCSVVGCDSGRRSAQRFKLPEDPERRLEWVQFLATVNKQRFKESSWTDITICSEHFKDDCFYNLTQIHSGLTGRVQLMLSPGAVPSLCVQSQETNVDSPQCAEPEETTEVACQRDQLKTCDGPTSFSEESMGSRRRPVPRGGSRSTHSSNAFIFVSSQLQPEHISSDLIREKAALLQVKGKYVVNEKRLLQLFSHKCPSCGSKVKMEKVTYGVLVIMNQQCLQCDYRYQWKSQVNASVPTAEDHLTEAVEVDVTAETQQAVPAGDTEVPEIVSVIDEESDPMDESSDQGEDSDEDWKPMRSSFHARVLKKKPDDGTEDEEEEEDYPPVAPKHSELCTECGMFFSKQKPHTCEHKIKPYSCNICGKRCVSENALITHSRIHNDNYEYRCKYCQGTFKTKVDKITHQQIHLTQGKPYKCPDCSETFATNKERRTHLRDHRGPEQLKCHICGIEFVWPLSLQRHLAVHTGVKSFKCSVCQRGFNQAGHLKSHMRLHTGERPFKCQHCDKSFNHNVSLKSHVQRYHSASSGGGGAQDNGNKRGADSGLDNEEEQDADKERQKERMFTAKKKRKSTGRPKGRPKSYEPGNLVDDRGSDTNTGKLQVQLKRRQCSDEASEEELSNRDTSFDSADEESSKKATKNTAGSRRRSKTTDSDSDFDPEERKKKSSSSQSGAKSSGRRRGRPRKSLTGE